MNEELTYYLIIFFYQCLSLEIKKCTKLLRIQFMNESVKE